LYFISIYSIAANVLKG